VVTVPHDERREPFVEVLTAGDRSERLVTAIELLSPSDKAPGERGRELYLRKQRELLDSPSHLVEIDLLRGGTHTTAVPLERLLAQVDRFDYHVSVHRSDRFEDFRVYPVRLDERLPEIAVPLLTGDAEIPLDLQAVFERSPSRQQPAPAVIDLDVGQTSACARRTGDIVRTTTARKRSAKGCSSSGRHRSRQIGPSISLPQSKPDLPGAKSLGS
jgi:hypothetical protein